VEAGPAGDTQMVRRKRTRRKRRLDRARRARELRRPCWGWRQTRPDRTGGHTVFKMQLVPSWFCRCRLGTGDRPGVPTHRQDRSNHHLKPLVLSQTTCCSWGRVKRVWSPSKDARGPCSSTEVWHSCSRAARQRASQKPPPPKSHLPGSQDGERLGFDMGLGGDGGGKTPRDASADAGRLRGPGRERARYRNTTTE
jgi:hypothetical protein